MTNPEHPLLGARVELQNVDGCEGATGEVLVVGELACRDDDRLYAVVEIELSEPVELPPVIACPIDGDYLVEIEEACRVRA